MAKENTNYQVLDALPRWKRGLCGRSGGLPRRAFRN